MKKHHLTDLHFNFKRQIQYEQLKWKMVKLVEIKNTRDVNRYVFKEK